jgi:hypothetical protein
MIRTSAVAFVVTLVAWGCGSDAPTDGPASGDGPSEDASAPDAAAARDAGSGDASRSQPDGAADSTPPITSRAFALLSVGARFLSAVGGGGGQVTASGVSVGSSETFTMESVDSAIHDGSLVRIRAHGGQYLVADNGGGTDVHATGTPAGPFETFTVHRIGGAGAINWGDTVSLQTSDGHYVVAEDAGTGLVRARSTAVGPWETFTVKDPNTPPPPDGEAALQSATVLFSPPDVASFPATTKITAFSLTNAGFQFLFTKRDGPDSWPDVLVFPPDGMIEYTQWILVKVNGKWYTAAGQLVWRDPAQTLFLGGNPSGFTTNIYYAADRWAPITNYAIANGEYVGFFVTAGASRNNQDHTGITVAERSNVVMIPFPGDAGGVFKF